MFVGYVSVYCCLAVVANVLNFWLLLTVVVLLSMLGGCADMCCVMAAAAMCTADMC